MLQEPYKNSMLCLLATWLSLIKFCDPSWFCSVYALDLRFYVQMNRVLHKYCLTMLIEKKRKREDGMPKKHDPKKREREKRWHAKEAWPSNKIKHEKEHVFICALTWSVINMSTHLWIHSLILQQIWAKQTTFYLIYRNSTNTIKTGEVK